ncbi:hypothetical protein INR79_27020 [Vibrio sp. SCSIO 43132]|uniref:hypothetical protein n=1 Tax=Vibrio sp. SCSIO 43132 TaxID=2779363 RepID=UPI001CA99C4D|nr:hypothetical protein [Vibrio sp. SCSIO 43132]UAB72898.1 hypothetical protein INR79_27020 [Vibrio sp. SCSIO 43132]
MKKNKRVIGVLMSAAIVGSIAIAHETEATMKHYVKFVESCKAELQQSLASESITVIDELLHDKVLIVEATSEQAKSLTNQACVEYVELVPEREMHSGSDPFSH